MSVAKAGPKTVTRIGSGYRSGGDSIFSSFVPDKSPEPPQYHNDEQEKQVMQIKPATKRQCQGQTQQTSQNAYEKAVHHSGLLGSSRHPEGHNECQQHFQPRYQPGTDPRREMINRTLVGSAPCLKGQDERIDGDYPHHDEETHHNDYKSSAENAEPPNSG